MAEFRDEQRRLQQQQAETLFTPTIQNPNGSVRGNMPNQQKALSDSELDEVRDRCAAASPGPWRSFIEGRDHVSGSSFIMTGSGRTRGNDIELLGATPADQDFIAHARQDIPRLLDEIARLKRLISSAEVTL